MATLVLTAVGTAIGGPIGGAIGAALGQQLDRAVIGTGPRREGARLKELELQTSSYGTVLPAIYGAMRVAGTVIWASDLIERRTVNGGSKTRAGTTSYSYSVNLAVALSSKPIERIGRIWADGNLLRGANGDLKVETNLRIHAGWDDQPADPLIASNEGAALCPAYRGLAYIVFEGLQLADFGNRIPSLTFEIFEREGAVRADELLNHASGGKINGSVDEMLDGYALQGQDQRSSIAPLIESLPVIVRPEAGSLRLEGWFADPIGSFGNQVVVFQAGRAVERPLQKRGAATKAPRSFALRHFEPVRDYQVGLQRFGFTTSAGRELQYDLPAALSTIRAHRLATLLGLQNLASNASSSSTLAYAEQIPELGMRDSVTDHKITEIEYSSGCIKIVGNGWLRNEIASGLPTDAGRDTGARDVIAGQTLLHVIDLPSFKVPVATQPRLGVVAAGTGEGWRRAALSLREGLSSLEIGRTAAPGTIATLQTQLPAHVGHLLDMSSKPILRLRNSAMELPPGTGNPLATNAPIIHVAGEFLKYGECQQVGVMDFQLHDLVRGCFGTEHRIASHVAGLEMALVTPEQVATFESLNLAIDSTGTIEAVGIADLSPIVATIANVGLATRPLSPVHLRARKDAAGDLHINWVRRGRLDSGWRDYGDQPMDESVLAFDVDVTRSEMLISKFQTDIESCIIPAAIVNEWDVPAGGSVEISVRQIGTAAISLPCRISFPI